MFKLVLLVLSAVALGHADIGFGSIRNYYKELLAPKIVGGQEAASGEFPYQASLRLKGPLQTQHFCGGSILREDIVLTAGHCITEVQVPPFNHIEVASGLTSLKTPGDNVQISKISKTVVHPDYPGGVAPNDIAIHFLETPFKFNDFVQPIALPADDYVESGDAVLSGWGSTSTTSNPKYPDHLQKAVLPFVPYDECEAAYTDLLGSDSTLVKTNVCTGPLSGGRGACSGDSGGPLVDSEKAFIVGVVSWGMIPCGSKGAPSVYTRVSSFASWIKEETAAA